MLIDKRNLPLNALRVFEAVGRHRHMRRAADELCVSHSAVSQQVRKLEHLLGVVLFERIGTRLQLTNAGTRLLTDVNVGLEQLAKATKNVSLDAGVYNLKLACAQGLCINWLVPNLVSFTKDYPCFKIQLEHLEIFPSSFQIDADLMISYGKPQISEERVTRLPSQELIPICSPQVYRQTGREPLPARLAEQVLLHVDNGEIWSHWFAKSGYEHFTSSRNIHLLGGHHVVLEGVKNSLGIGIIDRRWVSDDIKSGRLIQLSELGVYDLDTYYIVRPEEGKQTSASRIFEQWLLDYWKVTLA